VVERHAEAIGDRRPRPTGNPPCQTTEAARCLCPGGERLLHRDGRHRSASGEGGDRRPSRQSRGPTGAYPRSQTGLRFHPNHHQQRRPPLPRRELYHLHCRYRNRGRVRTTPLHRGLAPRLEPAKLKVVLGDGAIWIWNLANQHFPGALQIVDLFHTRQHLWELSAKLFPSDTGAKRWVDSKPKCSRTNSRPPDSCPVCPLDRSTAEPLLQNAFPAWENLYHPRSTPPLDRVSTWREAHTAAPAPASLRRPMVRQPPSGAVTGECGEHCPEPPSPSARHSCALRAATIPCSSSSTACVDRHAPRRWPGPQYMPRSASAVGPAKRGVIRREQFYIKLFFFDIVILDPRAAPSCCKRSTADFTCAEITLSHLPTTSRECAYGCKGSSRS